ncbi:MAG TPA: hypothetical protein EYQ86_01615, partial [Bacteroidetes bacterium]|nr:hypothetical protein [Bacteroidota bacterium]
MVFLFDFIFPGFLWAMSLLSVPLLIHLFYFRRYKRQYFSNVLLLKQLQEKRATRNQLKYWLVLISRLLILIFLVLAFSQPFLGTDNIADNSKWTSIYIDNSFSMSLDDGSGSLLSKAVRFAKEHVFNNDAATKYQILSNGLLLKKKQFLDKQEALEAIDRINLMPYNMP